MAMRDTVRRFGITTLCVVLIILPWVFYVHFNPRIVVVHDLRKRDHTMSPYTQYYIDTDLFNPTPGNGKSSMSREPTKSTLSNRLPLPVPQKLRTVDTHPPQQSKQTKPVKQQQKTNKKKLSTSIPTDGARPLFGARHKGTDAIFALACDYPLINFKRFVGSLRKSEYNEDIVLGVSPVLQMKTGVEEYLRENNVLAYSFDVNCTAPDSCKLVDDFLGYPDPRPYRTFSDIR
jgi:hypothetical protein